MNSIKEIHPSFEKVSSVTDSKEFIQTFCMKALKLLDEFNKDYAKAIITREINKLDSATHKIASTMRWLDLDDFVSFTKSYKESTLVDRNKNEKLLNEVLHYSKRIENSIRKKLHDL
jgi:hypothetical protein